MIDFVEAISNLFDTDKILKIYWVTRVCIFLFSQITFVFLVLLAGVHRYNINNATQCFLIK